MSIISEQISTYFLCKGTWIPIPHCVLRSDKNKLNEKLGYCSVCWTNEAKENSYSSSPEVVKHQKPFSDSKINPNSGPCGNDTL